MPDDEIFRLIPDTAAAAAAAERLFEVWHAQLCRELPPGCDIRHIGATAVPGCLTKGDLDIVVRAPGQAFAAADACLARLLARNTGSEHTADFASFKDDDTVPPLGIQLTAVGGSCDDFHLFAERLRASPQLVEAYNDLKRRFDGQPMETYRAAKGVMIATVLASPQPANP